MQRYLINEKGSRGILIQLRVKDFRDGLVRELGEEGFCGGQTPLRRT